VLDREAQPARPRRTEHQPVRALGKVLVGQRPAEELVVGAEVLDGDPALGDAGRAAGLEDVNRPSREPFRNPALDRTAAQPLVLEQSEAPQVVEAADLAARVPAEARGEIEPKRRSGGGIEMPVDHLPDPRVELGARLLPARIEHRFD